MYAYIHAFIHTYTHSCILNVCNVCMCVREYIFIRSSKHYKFILIIIYVIEGSHLLAVISTIGPIVVDSSYDVTVVDNCE